MHASSISINFYSFVALAELYMLWLREIYSAVQITYYRSSPYDDDFSRVVQIITEDLNVVLVDDSGSRIPPDSLSSF
jgi:hypothetical protein